MRPIEESGESRFAPTAPASRPAKLTKWQPAAAGPPRPAPERQILGSKFDPSRLRPLTPYAMPVPVAEQAAPLSKAAARAEGVGTNGWLALAQPRETIQGRPAMTLDDKVGREPGPTEQPGKEKTRRVYQLTWDEYNKLDDAQRAAVDFNTLLVQAREKDLNTDYEATEEQREKFAAEAEKMFGAGKGSETFAPETLGVLKQIDFKASGEEDLDDFLGLKATINAKDLESFSFDKEVSPPQAPETPAAATARELFSPGGAGGLETTQRAAIYTENLEASMARAGELLQTLRASAARDRNDEVLALGGLFNEVNKAPGYGDRPAFVDENRDGLADTGNFHSYAQDTLAALANAKLDPKVAFTNMAEVLEPAEKRQIMRYFDEQTKAAGQHGTGVFGLEGPGVRSPQEIRQLLGLDKGD